MAISSQAGEAFARSILDAAGGAERNADL